ncbi:hypothetical protein ACI65C_006753 [Semiaphis heraclei]
MGLIVVFESSLQDVFPDVSTNSTVSSSDIRPLNNSTVVVCGQSTPYSSSNAIKDKINTGEYNKSYLYIKASNTSSFSAAIRQTVDCCFEYHILALFSYKGKT